MIHCRRLNSHGTLHDLKPSLKAFKEALEKIMEITLHMAAVAVTIRVEWKGGI